MIGYIDSSSFPVYTYGEMFIYPGLYSYYMSWTPTSLSGYFRIYDDTLSSYSSYLFNDYDGLFTDKDGFGSYIGFKTFESVGITTLETNAEFVSSFATIDCSFLKKIYLPNCRFVGKGAFDTAKSLEYISIPVCEEIHELAFESTAVSSLVLPECSIIRYNAFYGCARLSYISAKKCNSIGDGAFKNCKSLLTAYVPSVDTIWFDGFRSCINLKYINMTSCTDIMAFAFNECKKLVAISVPYLKRIGDCAFLDCMALSTVSLPAVSYINDQAFGNCNSLNSVYISGACSYIGNLAFNSCSKLSEITLNLSNVCKLSTDEYVSAGLHFANTPIESGTGRIYVRSSLVNAYKSASFWSEYSSQIYPINN